MVLVGSFVFVGLGVLVARRVTVGNGGRGNAKVCVGETVGVRVAVLIGVFVGVSVGVSVACASRVAEETKRKGSRSPRSGLMILLSDPLDIASDSGGRRGLCSNPPALR